MKKFLALLLALVMTTALLVGCGKTATPTPTPDPVPGADPSAPVFETQKWKFACSATETSTWMEAAKLFGQKVNEATGGAVTVEYYAADQLTAGDQKGGIQALMDGTTELSMHSNLIYSGFDPRFNVVSLPFLFSSTADADSKLDGAGGDALKTVLEEKGLHCMGIAENGFRHITNSKHEIAALSDMSGLKIRVAGSALLKDAFTAWGSDPAGANWSEVFTALQTRTYDGQENPLPTADAASIQEVQKFVTYWTGTYDCLFFCMNKDLYDSLTPELQAIVDDCGQQAVEYQRQLNREQDKIILDKWTKDSGILVTELTPEAAAEFKAASDSLYEKYAAEMTPELIASFTGK